MNKYSDLKIFNFPEKVQSFRTGQTTAPIYVRIKPLNLCNDHCWWCVYHAPDLSQMHQEMEARDQIKLPKMLEILEDLAAIGVKAVTYSGGGEPLMHKDAAEFLRRTVELGLDLSVITNGQFLKGERAAVLAAGGKWVRVSMDYCDGKQLKEFRGAPERCFDERMENLEAFASLKAKAVQTPACDLEVNFIVHKGNYHRLFEMAERLKGAGVENIRFSPMWVSPGFREYHEQIVDLAGMPLALNTAVEAQLRRIQNELAGPGFTINTTYDLDNRAHGAERGCTRCLFMQTVPVIGADLNVYSCHNKAYDASGLIGSLAARKFSELWFSAEARARFEALNPQVVCRHQCANDSKVRLYDQLAKMSADNFV